MFYPRGNRSSCKTLEDRLEKGGVKVMRIHRAFQWCQEDRDTSILDEDSALNLGG